ncbi:MAG: IS630 family transposase [Candidatus Nitrosocosmicus sp.]
MRFEKKYIEQLRYSTPPDPVLLYVDEKGPITAKTHGGTSWSSTQVKVEKAKKINGLLNVFGAYDHTNDKMHVHSYRNKTGKKQFVDFLKRVDRRYDKDILNIFVVLDNLSVHKSKKVKEDISKCCPRIKLVFLPVRSPELNLIEVRWSWLQRQTINNSTFKDEQEIGRVAVSKWKNTYNKNHGRAIINILQKYVPLCLHSC